jgi:hypothetical protein
MPQLKDLRRNPVLTNVSKAWKNDSLNFIADQVFPSLPVDEDSGSYFVYDKTNLKNVDSRIAPNGKALTPEIEYNLSKVSYGPLEKRKLKLFVDEDELKRSKPPLDPRIDATEILTESFMINKEANAAALLSNTAVITQNTTLAGINQWSDFGNSTPFDDIRTGITSIKQNGLKLPNTLVMSWEVWSVIQNHPDFLERIKYTEKGVLTTAGLSSLLGIPNIVIGMAAANTAKEGATDALSPIWGKSAWLMNVNQTPGIKQLSAGYTLQLTDGRGVDNYVSNDPVGEYVRVSDYYLQYIMAAELIYGIFGAVA